MKSSRELYLTWIPPPRRVGSRQEDTCGLVNIELLSGRSRADRGHAMLTYSQSPCPLLAMHGTGVTAARQGDS